MGMGSIGITRLARELNGHGLTAIVRHQWADSGIETGTGTPAWVDVTGPRMGGVMRLHAGAYQHPSPTLRKGRRGAMLGWAWRPEGGAGVVESGVVVWNPDGTDGQLVSAVVDLCARHQRH